MQQNCTSADGDDGKVQIPFALFAGAVSMKKSDMPEPQLVFLFVC